MICTYCGCEGKKHEVIRGIGVKCKPCDGICGDFQKNPSKKKRPDPLLQLRRKSK